MPRNGRSRAFRVLEHGTRIYAPTASRGYWRVVSIDERGRVERTATTEEEALDIARRAEEFLAARISPRSGRTVAELAASYLEHLETRGRAERYVERQEALLRLWITPEIGGLALTDWGPYESEQVLGAAQRAGLSASRCQAIGATLRGLVSHAHLRRWLPRSEDPMADVEYSVKAEFEGESASFVPPEDIPTHEAVEALASALESMYEPHWGLACRLAAQSGLRWGELVALRPVDISLEAAQRTVDVVATICEPDDRNNPPYRKSTKSSRKRKTIYYASLTDELRGRVEEVAAERGPEGLLFPGPDGGFARRLWFRPERMLPAMRAAGWQFERRRTPRHSWHALRHLAATTMLFERGLDLNLVSYLLGHANPGFTLAVYVGNRQDAIGRAMAATADV